MNPLLVLLSACAAVVVLASPHHIARHNALAARVALAIPDDPIHLHRRQSNKRRCKPRSLSSENRSSTPIVNPPSTQNPSPSASPTPAPNYLPTTSTTPSPAPTKAATPNNNLPSYTGGDATFYSTGLGACGITNVDSDYIVALSHTVFDQFTPNGDPNHNTLCNKKIHVTYLDKSVTVVAVDRCEGCQVGDLDFSPSAFDALAPRSAGRVNPISWQFVD